MDHFPDDYYQETDPARRRQILMRALETEDTAADRIRERLWDLRYKEMPRSKEVQWTDAYIRLWMALRSAAQYANSLFGGRGAKKEVRRILDALEIASFLQQGQEARDLLYREFYHGACVYLKVCSTDRNYSSAFMGMVPMKESSVQAKIARDLYESLYVGVRTVQAEEELALLRLAARAAFDDLMPAQSGYLQGLIGEDREGDRRER